MKKILLLNITFVLFIHITKSQDFNSEFKSLFINLPIKDSIENIINGEYGLTFKKHKEKIELEIIKDIFVYTSIFSNPELFKNTPGLISIQRSRFTNSPNVNYAITIKFYFESKEEQIAAYESILKKFEKCTNKTYSAEQVNNNSEALGHTSILEYEDQKLRVEIFYQDKEHKLSILYMMRKK